VCAEMMKEMLQRDFAETIHAALTALPSQKKEKEVPKEKEKKRERDREADEVTNTKVGKGLRR
jgi:hypothetical protein